MRRIHNGWTGLSLLILTAFLVVACQPQGVDQLRQNYEAQLNSWYQQDTPAVAEGMITVTDEGEDGEATADSDAAPDDTSDAAEDEEMAAVEDGPDTLNVTSRVTLDILLSHEGAGTLPGITLDIYQANADGEEQRNWKLWVDTSDMAVNKQVTQTLENVELDEGDQFAVEVRSHVPEGERQEYREFAMHSGS